MHKYLKSSALVLLYLSIYFGVQILVTIIFTVIKTIEFFANHSADLSITNDALMAVQQDVLGNTTLIVIISIFVSLPLYTLASKITKESFIKICSFNRIRATDSALSLITGLSLAVFIMLVLSYIDSIYPLDKIPGSYDNLMENIMGGNFYVTFLAVGILAPIMEEIIFRGFILNELRKIMPAAAAIIVQAVLFGVIHFNIVQSSYAFVTGVVLGIVFVATKSLFAPIIIHLSFNTLNVILSEITINQQLEQYSLIILVASFLISLSSIYILWVKQKNINGIE
uniref:CPBP family intramembrane glutamic endopeptidase n=1 Tax=Acetivibrio cellulolyticus TaxID=35830 RepID=UPI0001E2E375|nr:type II CAAX endopeptidase family protein [Acetivibrio cellulolyticus]